MADDDLLDSDTGADTDDVDDTDDKDEGGEPDKDKDFKPPTREQWQAQQRQLARANAQNKRLKEAAKNAPKPDEDDAEAQKKVGYTEAEAKYKPRIVKAEARAQLSQMGLKGTPDRFLRLLDMDAIEVSDDEEIDGLDEQLEQIKSDFPDLFDGRRVKGDKRTRADAGDKDSGGHAGPSGDEKLAQWLTTGKKPT